MSDEIRPELDALRRRKANVKPREIEALLGRLGCERRSGKGDHWVFTHPRWRAPVVVDPGRPTLLLKVVRAALELIDDEH